MEDIELVIKISEDSYKAICNGRMLPPRIESVVRVIETSNGLILPSDVEDVVNAIKNGTPLPKIIDSLKELSKDHRHNYVGNSHEERAWRLGIEDSIDLILAESEET